MKKVLSIISLFALILLVTSCLRDISNVDSDRVFPVYSLAILDDDTIKVTFASAIFYQSFYQNSRLFLDQGSIEFNGLELRNTDYVTYWFPHSYIWDERENVEPRYHILLPNAVHEGTFKFTNSDFNEYVNQVKYINEINPVNSVYTVKIGDTLTIYWQGMLKIHDEDIFVEGPTYANAFVNGRCYYGSGNELCIVALDSILVKDNLVLAPPSTHKVRLIRKSEDRTKDDPGGGIMDRRYCSKEFTIHVIH